MTRRTEAALPVRYAVYLAVNVAFSARLSVGG
jgi:hypothetical protein